MMIWIIVTIAVIVLAAVGFYTYKLFSFNESVVNEKKQLKHQKINLKQSLEKAQFDSERIQKAQKEIERYKNEQEKLIQSQIEFLQLREQKIAQKEDELKNRIDQFENEKLVFFQRLQGKEYCLNTGLTLLQRKYQMVADSTKQIRQQQNELNNFHNIIDREFEKLASFFETTESLIDDLEFEHLLLVKEKNLLESAKNEFLIKKQELHHYAENLNSQFLKIQENQRELENQQSVLLQRSEQFDKEKSEIQDRLSAFDNKEHTLEMREEKLQKELKELALERSRFLKRIGDLDAREKELEENARKLENWGQELVNKDREIKKWENQLQAKEKELNDLGSGKGITPENNSNPGTINTSQETITEESGDLSENDLTEFDDTSISQEGKTDNQADRNLRGVAGIRLIKGTGAI